MVQNYRIWSPLRKDTILPSPTGSLKRSFLLLAIIVCLLFGGAAYGQSVDFSLNPDGLQSLKYNGWEFINDPGYQGDFCVYGPTTIFQQSDGSTYNGATNWTSSSMDFDAKKITLTFAWGILTCTYSKSGTSRMNFHVTATNSTSDTLTNAYGKLLVISTPNVPVAYDPLFGELSLGDQGRWAEFNTQAGAVLLDLSTTGKVALSLDNPATSLSAVGSLAPYGGSYIYDITWSMKDSVGPGATGTFDASLRFGGTSSTMLSLAGDTYQKLDAEYPVEFNWTDRRLIGRDFLSSTVPHPADGKNPRGWFNNDDTIDITTQAGLEDFQTRMLARVDSHISYLQSNNCQGVIIWDIEGQEFPHAISYVGDPDMMDTAAPEMNFQGSRQLCVADEIFQKYHDAGFKVGICIRPQQFVYDGNGWYTQVNADDPGQEILDDVTYAIERWGVDFFYVDSTVDDPFGGNSLPATPLFERVLQKYPNILLMAENQQPKYYAYGAPYESTYYDYSRGTPGRITEMYQGAATLLTMHNYQSSWHDDILAAVKRGDILSANSWYADSDLAAAKAIYDEVGARPTVSITSPTDYDAYMNPSSVTVSASANGNGKTLQKVEFYAGPIKVGEDTTSPYSISWTDFTPWNQYCLYAKAITTDGCSTVSAPVHVKITPTYEQVGSTLSGPYATPDSVANDVVFSTTGDIPNDLAIQNGVIPDMWVEYTLTLSGVTGYGTQLNGNGGLALFTGSTPSKTDALFTGVYHPDDNDSRGALTDDVAESDTPYGPQETASSSYTATVDVTKGVVSTYLNGVNWLNYTLTPADIAAWAGQTKFAAFHGGPGTDWQYARSSISNVKFYKVSQVATPTISVSGGTYYENQSVTLSCSTSGATIRYTTDVSDPTSISTQYTGAITIAGSCTLKARAFKTGYKDSSVSSAAYTITRTWSQIGSTLAGPYWTPDATGGGFSSVVDMPSEVTIQSGVIPDLRVEYTLSVTGISGWGYQPNGNSGLAMFLSSTPSNTDGAFTGVCHPDYSVSNGAIVGNLAAIPDPAPYRSLYSQSSSYTVAAEIVGGVATTTITGQNSRYYSVTSTDISNWGGQTKFAAFHSSPGVNWSYGRASVSNVKFYTKQQVAAPTFSPTPGTYTGTQAVTISSTTSGATIRYTTDGSTPSQTHGTVYSSAVSINTNTVLRAIAYKVGMSDSAVATGTYTIIPSNYNSTFTKAFTNTSFETQGGGGVSDAADWWEGSPAHRELANAATGQASMHIEKTADTYPEVRYYWSGSWQHTWNADTRQGGVNASPGTVFGYSFKAKNANAGTVGNAVFLTTGGALGTESYGYYAASVSSTSYATKTVAGRRTTNMSLAWDTNILLRSYLDATGSVYFDDYSGVQFIRPEVTVSDFTIIDLGVVAPNTASADSSTRTIINSQATTADCNGTAVASILYGTVNAASAQGQSWNQSIDDVGAKIIGASAGLFEFVTNHFGATNQELKLIGADGNAGLLGGSSPESENLVVKFLGSSTVGTYTATIRIVTNGGNTGIQSTGQTGEPMTGLCYIDIPVTVTVE